MFLKETISLYSDMYYLYYIILGGFKKWNVKDAMKMIMGLVTQMSYVTIVPHYGVTDYIQNYKTFLNFFSFLICYSYKEVYISYKNIYLKILQKQNIYIVEYITNIIK